MKPNNIKPTGIAKYTSLKYKYEREARTQPNYGQPTFPYTYRKNARVSFLDQVQVIPYRELDPPTPRRALRQEITPPTPRQVPIPYSLLSEIQLLWILSATR
jgi:hypothetical protein